MHLKPSWTKQAHVQSLRRSSSQQSPSVLPNIQLGEKVTNPNRAVRVRCLRRWTSRRLVACWWRALWETFQLPHEHAEWPYDCLTFASKVLMGNEQLSGLYFHPSVAVSVDRAQLEGTGGVGVWRASFFFFIKENKQLLFFFFPSYEKIKHPLRKGAWILQLPLGYGIV